MATVHHGGCNIAGQTAEAVITEAQAGKFRAQVRFAPGGQGIGQGATDWLHAAQHFTSFAAAEGWIRDAIQRALGLPLGSCTGLVLEDWTQFVRRAA